MVKKKTEPEAQAFIPWLKHIGSSIFFGVIFLFLATNILFAISLPEFDSIVRGDKQSVINFMKHTYTLSSFFYLFPEIKNMFALNKEEIYKDEKKRKDMIVKLEKTLLVNSKSRDVLYALYLLYEKSGESEKATKYLQRAQEVDPQVGK